LEPKDGDLDPVLEVCELEFEVLGMLNPPPRLDPGDPDALLVGSGQASARLSSRLSNSSKSLFSTWLLSQVGVN
jgi:hypothetical protein